MYAPTETQEPPPYFPIGCNSKTLWWTVRSPAVCLLLCPSMPQQPQAWLIHPLNYASSPEMRNKVMARGDSSWTCLSLLHRVFFSPLPCNFHQASSCLKGNMLGSASLLLCCFLLPALFSKQTPNAIRLSVAVARPLGLFVFLSLCLLGSSRVFLALLQPSVLFDNAESDFFFLFLTICLLPHSHTFRLEWVCMCVCLVYIKLSLTSSGLIIPYNASADTLAWVKVTSQ